MTFVRRVLLVGGAGYIGSYLFPRLVADGYSVDVCDLGKRGLPLGPVHYPCAYADLQPEQLAEYDRVLWFAGHSSVPISSEDPHGALANNCFDLYHFARKLTPATRLIYASTASLYSGITQSTSPCHEDQPIAPNRNAYDISKFAFDYIASGFLSNFVGLRMGTLSGYSPNMRPELIFNAMNISALQTGVIHVSNPEASRSLLFLSDLHQAIRKCIDLTSCPDGFFNLASVSGTIGDIARMIADHHGAKIHTFPGSSTYSFQVATEKAETTFDMQFSSDMSHHCREFTRTWMEQHG